jgi:hypothetical protein
MKLNSKPTTDIEQSKRLLTLGIKKETADFGYFYEREEHEDWYNWEIRFLDDNWQSYWDVDDDSIPAWSLCRLIEMMPCGFQDENYHSYVLCVNSIGVSYECHEEYDDGEYFYRTKGPSYIHDNLFDDIIAYIEWLISEGLFNEEYLNKK